MNNSQHPLNLAQCINVFRVKQKHGGKWYIGFGNNRNSSSCMCLAHNIHGVCKINGSAGRKAHGKVQKWCRAIGINPKPSIAPITCKNQTLYFFSCQRVTLRGIFSTNRSLTLTLILDNTQFFNKIMF
jgi:hypothetical protein